MHARRRAARRTVPWLVWLAAAGGAAWLHRQTSGAGQAAGMAEVREFTVGALETGRLASVEVVLGDHVQRGSVLARMDSGNLEQEAAVAETELRERQAAVAAEDRTLYLNSLETEREFEAELDDARAQREAAEAALTRERAELASVRGERDRQKDLVARRLADSRALNELSLRLEALEAAVAAWPSRIAALAAREQAARRRLALWRAGSGGASGNDARRQQLRPLELRTVRQAGHRELLNRRLRDCAILSPASGRVTKILALEGAVLRPGDPVVAVTEEARQVVAYAGEESGARLRRGDRVSMRAREGARPVVEGTVAVVAAAIGPIPERFWPSPNRPQWGREVYIQPDSAGVLDPGQAVDVTFFRPSGRLGNWFRVFAWNAARHRSGLPQPLHVPETLSQRTRLEPSGLVWAPELRRYLVVSDDTGLEIAGDNAPWLFALDEAGRFDPDPVVVRGAGAVNDLEAIARAPDGTLYAIASQSENRQGKRRPARTVFLRMRIEGGELKATGVTSFYRRIAEATESDPRLAGELGLPAAHSGRGLTLEIEGMTWHQGVLLLGLKGPLDDQGRTPIWALSKPDALFDDGTLRDAGLRLWGRVAMQAAGEPVGISELLSLGGDRLLAAGAGASGGAVFLVRPSRGTNLRVELVASYPGWKPEGMCLAPGGGRIAVVFDRDGGTPYWTHLESPE